MTGRRRALPVGGAALALLATAWLLCGGCRKTAAPAIATLVETAGLVEGETAAAPWRAVATGAGFGLGDAVRTGPGAVARLRVTEGGTLRMGEKSLVRFRLAAPGAQGPEVAVDFGQTEIAEVTGLSVSSPAGRLRVEPGARVRIDAEAERAKLEVIVGRAIVTSSTGDVAVDAGQGLSLRVGGVILERFELKVGEAKLEALQETGRSGRARPATAPAAVPAVAASAPAAVPPRDAKPSPGDAARARADVTLTAGDSAVLHNEKLPLAVRLRFDQLCPGEARVALGRHASPLGRDAVVGSGAVVLRLRAGRTPYRVRCVGGAPTSDTAGVLSVKRDSGNAPLARHAPSNTIEADGHRYTVLYQSRPPALTLAWAAPASATELALQIESDGKTRTLRTPTATYRLPSGALGEGTHAWWYVAKDGKTSPHTTLTIRFDNTAPTAQFFRGATIDGPAGAIPVDGVAVQGSKVSAAGQPLDVDEHGRFRAAVLPLAGDDAVAVLVRSPRGGAHYYIRRRASATP